MSFIKSSTSNVLNTLVYRIGYIESIVDESREKQVLVTELDAARSTVDRAISELETANLVQPSENGYQITSMGSMIVADFFDFVDTVDRVSQEYDHAQRDIPAIGVIETVIRRIEYLEYLREAPKDKRTLVDDLGMSRATVDRGLRELESAGLIVYAAGQFTITTFGKSLLSELFDLIETTELGQRLNPFLKWIPDDELDIDPRLFADAEILLPEQGDPWAMINQHVNTLRESNDGRVIQPVVSLHAMEAAYQRIVHEGATGASVVESSVGTMFQSNPAYGELVEEMIATGRFDLFVYDGTIPYYLGVFDDTVQIAADENGIPRAILETDSPDVRRWAENKYEEYRQQAELLKL